MGSGSGTFPLLTDMGVSPPIPRLLTTVGVAEEVGCWRACDCCCCCEDVESGEPSVVSRPVLTEAGRVRPGEGGREGGKRDR